MSKRPRTKRGRRLRRARGYVRATRPAKALRIAVLLAALVAAGEVQAKPWRWCGWYARHNLVTNDPGEKFNAACEWLTYGRPTSAHVGALVIWCSRAHHHVGKIVATDANGNFVVRSGNDGGSVRSRVRSVEGAQFRE